jgi:ankyrin repeat protein
MKHDPDGKKILVKFQKIVREKSNETGNPIGHLSSTEGRLKLLRLINAKAQTVQAQNGTSNKLLQAAMKAKDIVSTGAAASPPATIAVAGLFVALSIKQTYDGETKAMIECAELIAKIICRRAVEDNQIRSASPSEPNQLKELRQQLHFSYLDLYFRLLSTIAKLVYKFDSRVRRLFDNMIGWTDWGAEKKSLEDAERECDEDLKVIHRYITNPAGQPSLYARKGRNQLHMAAQRGYDTVVFDLLRTNAFDLNAKTGHGWTALGLAAEEGHIKCCMNLLDMSSIEKDSKNRNGHTALHIATRKDRVDVVGLLIKEGVGVNISDNDGRTALHLAAEFGRLNTLKVLRNTKGIKLDAQDSEGRTALHLATLKKNAPVVKALVEKGAKVDNKNKTKRTAFLDAAEAGSAELVKILQEHGADVNQVTANNQWSALHICASGGHQKCLKSLLSFPDININPKNSAERTPLHEASLKSRPFIIKALCDKGAKVDVRDKKKRTAFLDAAKVGNVECVKRLREAGANINQVTGVHKWSALHEAARGNKVSVAKYLVGEGIKKDMKVKGPEKLKDMTARQLAELSRNSKVLEVL